MHATASSVGALSTAGEAAGARGSGSSHERQTRKGAGLQAIDASATNAYGRRVPGRSAFFALAATSAGDAGGESAARQGYARGAAPCPRLQRKSPKPTDAGQLLVWWPKS